MACVSSILLSTCWNTSPQIIIWTICCHFKARLYYMIADSGHLGNWGPYWNDPNIRIVLIVLTVHSACSNTHNLLSKWTFSIFWQKRGFQDSPWRPSWKMAALLKFCLTRVIFLQGDPYRVFVPNLFLVSQFERFLHLSAPLRAPRHLPLYGEFTGDRLIPRTTGQ